jgi:hypothetical protein
MSGYSDAGRNLQEKIDANVFKTIYELSTGRSTTRSVGIRRRFDDTELHTAFGVERNPIRAPVAALSHRENFYVARL